MMEGGRRVEGRTDRHTHTHTLDVSIKRRSVEA